MNEQRIAEVIPVIDGPGAGEDWEVVDGRTGDVIALKFSRSGAEALAAELNAAHHGCISQPPLGALREQARCLRISGAVL